LKKTVSSKNIPSSQSSSESSDNETIKDSFDNETSKDSSPTQDTSEDRKISVFINPFFDNNNDD
jgi:hypothetical protein